MPNPYILMPQQSQDMSGLSPVYQNMAAQQQFQNQMAQQGNQLSQQAGQTVGGGGMNPLAMAIALRKGGQTDQNAINAKDAQMGGLSTYNPYTQYQVSNMYGTDPYSQQSRMLAAQEF